MKRRLVRIARIMIMTCVLLGLPFVLIYNYKNTGKLEYISNDNKLKLMNSTIALTNQINSAKVPEVKKAPKVVVEEKKEVTSEVKDVKLTEEAKNQGALDVFQGSMSNYGADCAGCSGQVASGKVNLYESIYYNDPTYGPVRVLAGDPSLPFGTIVRVKNSNIGDFLGAVLDRGGDIGFGRRFTFDLAYPSESGVPSTSYNCTFEIIRRGY